MNLYFRIVIALFVFASCKKFQDDPLPQPTPSNNQRLPVVTTRPVTEITVFSAKFSGRLIDSGSAAVTQAGFVVDTFPNPTLSSNVSKFIAIPDPTGNFSRSVTEASLNRTWYVRAFATNSLGTAYGEVVTFQTLPEKVFVGDVHIGTQQELVTFGANQYTRIKGSLTIDGPVTDLSPLQTLAVINFGCQIRNTQLVNFQGLERLEIIGAQVSSPFVVQNNPRLQNFTGLSELKYVEGYFNVINNDAMTSMAGLSKLIFQGYYEFRIENCDALVSLNGLESMKYIIGSIMLKDNPVLSDVSAWRNLELVSERIRVMNNPSLTQINAFELIRKLEGLEVHDNSLLSSMNGFRNLDTITEIITIDNNDALTQLTFLHKITTCGYINVKNNASLLNLEGLSNISKVMGALTIDNNSALVNLQGLRRLKTAEQLAILRNGSMTSIDGLDSLVTISGNAYSVIIAANSLLQNLNGLKTLTTAEGSVQVSQNPQLANFCGLKRLLQGGYNGFFFTEMNLANPTGAQILNTCP